MTYQSVVSFEYWTFIAQILNLFIQIYLFKRFLFTPVKNILAKRQAEIEGLYSDAETAKGEADEAKASYEAHLKNARQEANEITSRAIDSANMRSEEILTEARTEAQRTLEKAEKAIELDRQKAMNEARKEISGMAVDIASKLLRKEISQQDNQALIDQFIDEYGKEQ